ncbi:hypothetical protein CMV_004062 [Castanea mollissima]|uniref:Uncharacterized protein n=1 Tax=Castanea mollissima TaxID=60419 RepID=A0A8J4RUV0_9ROSI|nr:hypothetical protein CMV_004062 [Castanea mollissima]
MKQISKITRSEDFPESLVRVTEALTVGILRGYKVDAKVDGDSDTASGNLGFSDRVLEKLFSTAGTGFVSVVVGSFAKNLVLGYYSNGESGNRSSVSSLSEVPGWLNVVLIFCAIYGFLVFNFEILSLELDAKLVVDLLKKLGGSLNGNDVIVADCKENFKKIPRTLIRHCFKEEGPYCPRTLRPSPPLLLM